MGSLLASLFALISAASLATLANATMTTIMPLRLIADGAGDETIALFGAAYFAGFAVGCFSEPPRILRVGYIRALAAAAAICTTLAIVMDMTDWPALWIVLRFLMGMAIAGLFASVDGWITDTTPASMRGTIYSAYSWCIGAAAVISQLLLIAWDGQADGFITILAIAFNLAVVLVSLTRSTAPETRRPASEATPAASTGPLTITSWTAVLAAAFSGLVVTAILATLPALLSSAGVTDATIGLVIGCYFVGRLLFQIPVGMIADRMDLRLLIGLFAAATAAAAALAWFLIVAELARISDGASLVERVAFLGVAALLGGITLPIYTLAVALAFARADGQPPVRIATTLLLVNSGGAVAGPILVAVLLPRFDWAALVLVVGVASALTAVIALFQRLTQGANGPSATSNVEIPVTSVALTETVAEIQAEAQLEASGRHEDADAR
jgi:MFS family permease